MGIDINLVNSREWHSVIDGIRRNSHSAIQVRNPEATRPWQHVLEPLGGYLLLTEKLLSGENDLEGAWNFGPDKKNNIKVAFLVEKIINHYGHGKWELIDKKEKVHEAGLLALDINKAICQLGWHPQLNIEQTVTWTVEWYKNYRSHDMYKFCKNQINEYMKIWNSSNKR